MSNGCWTVLSRRNRAWSRGSPAATVFTLRRSTLQVTTYQRGIGIIGETTGDVSFSQTWNQVENSIDLKTLAEELTKVQQHMREDASQAGDPAAIGNIMRAQKAAQDGDGPGMLRFMKAAGRRALDVGITIGTPIAVAAGKAALGI